MEVIVEPDLPSGRLPDSDRLVGRDRDCSGLTLVFYRKRAFETECVRWRRKGELQKQLEPNQ